MTGKFVAGNNRYKNWKNRINERLASRFQTVLLAGLAALVVLCASVMLLFIPNYIGISGDGSEAAVMKEAGLAYPENVDNTTGYFVKTYLKTDKPQGITSSAHGVQYVLIRLAMAADDLITKDVFFDIRFLAGTYLMLFLPAFFFLMWQICLRLSTFTERVIACIVGVLIFSDVSYLSYFNSFYPEAVWYIAITYSVAAGLSFYRKRSGWREYGSLVLLLLAGSAIYTSQKEMGVLAFIFAAFVLKLIFVKREWIWRVVCLSCAFIFCMTGIYTMAVTPSAYTQNSKFHAMTRGVLFEASDPTEALAEFGINPSYEILTNVSAYDEIQFVSADNEALWEEFYSRYSAADIALYYVRHPGDFWRLLDLSVKSCFGIRRSGCGNYEQTVGLPQGAQSPTWGIWSSFKAASLPKTAGFLAILLLIAIVCFFRGYSARRNFSRKNTIYLDTLFFVFAIGLVLSAMAIIYSGDAEMTTHCFLVGAGADLILYILATEITHRLKLF